MLRRKRSLALKGLPSSWAVSESSGSHTAHNLFFKMKVFAFLKEMLFCKCSRNDEFRNRPLPLQSPNSIVDQSQAFKSQRVVNQFDQL
jgi:hypothetical protein